MTETSVRRKEDLCLGQQVIRWRHLHIHCDYCESERALRRAGRHRETNFFDVMLPVRSLMAEIYMCGENRNLPWKLWQGKSEPSDCFESGFVPRALYGSYRNLLAFYEVCVHDRDSELEFVPSQVCD